MSDFTLTPDELELPDTPGRTPRLVSTGLAPTAELPTPRKRALEAAPCYAPCRTCGALVLTGATREGTALALDTQTPTYTVVWGNGELQPLLSPSRAYPVHACPRRESTP